MLFCVAMISVIMAVFLIKSLAIKLVISFLSVMIFIFLLTFRLFFNKNCKILRFLFLIVISVIFLSTFFTQIKLTDLSKQNGRQVYISGQISNNYKQLSQTQILFDIENMKIDGVKVNGEVSVFLNPKNFDITKIKPGNIFSANCKIYYYDMNSDTSKLSYISNGKIASTSILSYQLEISENNSINIRDTIKNLVNSKLSQTEYGEVGYAMLFGDSTALDGLVKETFSATGVAHLLAVSGLHVSIVVLCTQFVLRKLKTPKILQILLIAGALGFYAYLCSFSVSVIRASFMSLFAIYATSRGKPYDNLTVLSTIGLIILLINPLSLFNLSFILSFTAVFSIILLTDPLTRFFDKILYRKFAEILALNVSIQIGLFVTQLYYFGRFPLFGILSNFVTVPVASFSFTCLIFLLLLSFVFPVTTLLKVTFGFPMTQIVKFNYWLSIISPILSINKISAFVLPLSLILILLLSDYVFLKRNTKVVLIGFFLSLIAIIMLL